VRCQYDWSKSQNRRQRSTSRGKPSSDSEIAHGKGKGKGRRNKVKERWPFIEGLTVDELARYRRRRVQDRPKDNLQPQLESAVRNPASEYRRAFGTTSVQELSKVFTKYNFICICIWLYTVNCLGCIDCTQLIILIESPEDDSVYQYIRS